MMTAREKLNEMILEYEEHNGSAPNAIYISYDDFDQLFSSADWVSETKRPSTQKAYLELERGFAEGHPTLLYGITMRAGSRTFVA